MMIVMQASDLIYQHELEYHGDDDDNDDDDNNDDDDDDVHLLTPPSPPLLHIECTLSQ